VFFNIAKLKTSSLFRWCALVAPNISKSSLTQEIDDFMTSFGLLFQYTDDFLDIFGNSGKENWNDLKEGKLNLVTWPMILKNASLYQTIVDDFSKKIVSEKLLISFDMVSKNKLVLKQARDNIQFVADQTLQALNKLPNSKIKLSLKDLVSICIDRTK
jgi:geranylgeranyl pyrophosphate synthase